MSARISVSRKARRTCSPTAPAASTFGYGYTPSWTIDEKQLNQYVWITGDSLCSPIGMCRAPASGQQGSEQAEGDPSEVHGIQGMKESLFAELAPASAYADLNPQQGYATESIGLDQSYLIDADVNVDASGTVIYEELTRDDVDQDRRYRDLRVLRRAVVWVRAGDGAAAGDDLRARPFADREPFALGLAQRRIQPLPVRLALAGHEPQSLGLASAAGIGRALAAGLDPALAAGLDPALAAGLGAALAAGLDPALAAGLAAALAAGIDQALPAGIDQTLAAGLRAEAFPAGFGEALSAWLDPAPSAGIGEAPAAGFGEASSAGLDQALAAGLGCSISRRAR